LGQKIEVLIPQKYRKGHIPHRNSYSNDYTFLASLFVNDKKYYKTAIEFLELGLRFYPDYLEFYVEIIEFYKILNNTKKADYYKGILRKKTLESSHLNSSKKKELLEFIDKK